MSISYTVLEEATGVRSFLRSRCQNGGPLMASIGAVIDMAGGTLLSLAPAGVPSERLTAFDVGGLGVGILESAANGIGPGDECLRAVTEFVRATPGGAAVVENQIAKPGDRHLQRFGDDIVAKGHLVYHIITTPSDAVPDMRARIMGAYAAWLFAVILGNERGLRSAIDAVWTENTDAVPWKEVVKEVWFDAYDGEGFVIWRPAWL